MRDHPSVRKKTCVNNMEFKKVKLPYITKRRLEAKNDVRSLVYKESEAESQNPPDRLFWGVSDKILQW